MNGPWPKWSAAVHPSGMAGMTQRPKRDLKRRWQRIESDAEATDRRARNGGIVDDSPRIANGRRLWAILERYGITSVGAYGLKKANIQPVELKRLRPPPVITVEDIPKRQEAVTLSVSLRDRLLSLVEEGHRAAAARDLDDWLLEDRECALMLHAKAWVHRHSGLPAHIEPRVPRFDTERDGGLVFDLIDSDVVWKRRHAELKGLLRRVDEVLPGKSSNTPGGGKAHARLALIEWRVLSPLLQWEESGFTERHWSELSNDELRRFVIAGYERENILAARDDDDTRIRAALRTRVPMPSTDVAQPAPSREDDAWDRAEHEAARVSYGIEIGAGRDAGNRSMRAGNRKLWNDEDCNAYVAAWLAAAKDSQ
jgi:hypothetical protein